jgi:hypothetical protein
MRVMANLSAMCLCSGAVDRRRFHQAMMRLIDIRAAVWNHGFWRSSEIEFIAYGYGRALRLEQRPAGAVESIRSSGVCGTGA